MRDIRVFTVIIKLEMYFDLSLCVFSLQNS